jgi:hypothetical protein
MSFQDNFQTIKDATKYLFLNQQFSDVQFLFIKDENFDKLFAHKLILSLRSPVFASMFNGHCKNESTIEIIDLSYIGFVGLLR